MTTMALMAIALLLGQEATARIESEPKPYWSGEPGWRVFAYQDGGDVRHRLSHGVW
jgi:hypothetical protein